MRHPGSKRRWGKGICRRERQPGQKPAPLSVSQLETSSGRLRFPRGSKGDDVAARVTGSAGAGCTRLSTCGRPANALTPHTRFSVASRLQPVVFRTVPAGELAGRIAPVPCGTQCEACTLASLCPKTGWESEFGDGFWKLKKHNKTRSGKCLKHLLALPRHPPI